MYTDLGDLSQFDSFFNMKDEESSESQEQLAHGTQKEAEALYTSGVDPATTVGGTNTVQSPDAAVQKFPARSTGGVAAPALVPGAEVRPVHLSRAETKLTID